MATKLYVGNLSFKTTGDSLRDLFSQAGTVESASVIEDRETGRSRGFGFVEMATAEDAAAAIEQSNGKEAGRPQADRQRGQAEDDAAERRRRRRRWPRRLRRRRRRRRGGYGGGGGGGGGYGGGGGGGRNDREPRW